MKVWTPVHFEEIFASIDVHDKDVYYSFLLLLFQVIMNMFKVWDFDKDGYVNIRDFVHTFAYAQLVSLFLNHF